MPPHMDVLQLGRKKFSQSERGKAFFKKNGVHLEKFRETPQYREIVKKFAEWSRKPRSEQHKRNISRALRGHQKSAEHKANHSASLVAGGKVQGENNPRARECIRLDTLETFGFVRDLVESLDLDPALDITATMGGVWDALNRSQYGGFYKGVVWICLCGERSSKGFSTQTDEGRHRRSIITGLIRKGLSVSQIRTQTGASEKLIRSVKSGLR